MIQFGDSFALQGYHALQGSVNVELRSTQNKSEALAWMRVNHALFICTMVRKEVNHEQ